MTARIEHACTYPGDEPDRGQCHDPTVHMLMAGIRIATTERDRLDDALLTIRRFAEAQAITAKANGRNDRDWLDLLAIIERAVP